MSFETRQVVDVLNNRIPERIPFIDRMDFWQHGLTFQGRLPEKYQVLSLRQIHQQLGFGMLEWRYPCAYKYHQLEITIRYQDQIISQAYEPQLYDFPSLWDDLPIIGPGEYHTEAAIPQGKLSITHSVSRESLEAGSTRPIMIRHPVQDAADARLFETILDQSEFVPLFAPFLDEARNLEPAGYLTPKLGRIPFQMLLLDVFGEIPLFYALHDDPKMVMRLMSTLDERMTDQLNRLSDLPVAYIECIDNLDGIMTNPRLFRNYVLPAYQEYTQIAHAQSKMLGSHTDGDLKSLISLLVESGLDVCESFTPAPMTSCTFDEAWSAWEHGPLIWGGIPSHYLEQDMPEPEFHAFIDRILAFACQRPIILGIGDAVMVENDLERLAWIARRVAETPVTWSW